MTPDATEPAAIPTVAPRRRWRKRKAGLIGLVASGTLLFFLYRTVDIRRVGEALTAALAAEGTSTIHNIGQIERGYENIDERLRALGADIQRLSD